MKTSQYPTPSHHSKTRKGTRPNDSKKPPVPGSGRGRPALGYNQETKTWDQK